MISVCARRAKKGFTMKSRKKGRLEREKSRISIAIANKRGEGAHARHQREREREKGDDVPDNALNNKGGPISRERVRHCLSYVLVEGRGKRRRAARAFRNARQKTRGTSLCGREGEEKSIRPLKSRGLISITKKVITPLSAI